MCAYICVALCALGRQISRRSPTRLRKRLAERPLIGELWRRGLKIVVELLVIGSDHGRVASSQTCKAAFFSRRHWRQEQTRCIPAVATLRCCRGSRRGRVLLVESRHFIHEQLLYVSVHTLQKLH